MDDLDDLLLDLETKNSSGVSLPSSDIKYQRLGISPEADNIPVADIDEEPSAENTSEGWIKSSKVKCCPVFIAGTNLPIGLSNLMCPKTCSVLHCRNCDFEVISYLNFEWTESVGYLFLRTNMPDSKKVSEMLRRKAGSVAYACHCVAYSTREQCSLHLVRTLPWFCRGHTEKC